MAIYTGILFKLFVCCIIGIASASTWAASSENKMLETSYNVDMDPALEKLIDQYIAQKKYKESIAKLANEIKKDPTNIALLYKEASLYADVENYYQSRKYLFKLKKLQPNNEKALNLTKIIDQKIKELPRHEIGFDQNESYVSDLKAYWSYSSLHYFRLSQLGTFGGRINYANRFGTDGVQYQIETYPQLLENMYAEITFGYSNKTQILFPNLQYRIEPYINFSNGLEISLGNAWQKYLTFHNQKIVSYTGSLGKYLGDYFIWYRPSFYQPTATWFSEFGLRRYFKEKHTSLTLKGNTGKIPDIGDLPPFDQILMVRQKGINIDGEYALTKTFFIKAGIGFTHQIYLSSMLLRDITNGSLGLTYQFK